MKVPSPVDSDTFTATESPGCSLSSQRNEPADFGSDGRTKRRKAVGGLRPCVSGSKMAEPSSNEESGIYSVRQVHSDTRFPQRKHRQEPSTPVMTPTSTDKLISGIWRQVHSEVQWGRSTLVRSSPRLRITVLVGGSLTVRLARGPEHLHPRGDE